MSEQKMPALPEPDWREQVYTGNGNYEVFEYHTAETVERIQREAYESGRQHERERLEPLRVAVEAYHAERRHGTTNSEIDAAFELYNEARTLLESDR